MSARIEAKSIPQPPLAEHRITKAICDRCGESALCFNEAARPGWRGGGPWCEIDSLVQGGDRWHADLCRSCSEELRDWIGAKSLPMTIMDGLVR